MGYKPETILESIVNDWLDNDEGYGYMFFSTTSPSSSGHNLAAYITKYNLGAITKMRPIRNGNTGHMLTMWVWTVNKRNFKTFCSKEGFLEESY